MINGPMLFWFNWKLSIVYFTIIEKKDMSKSKVRKKNGKPVKYTPNPTGISKTKMKKLMELLGEYNKQAEVAEGAIPEIRDRAGSLIIPSEFTKKMNVIATDEISNSGPELSIKEETIETPVENNTIDLPVDESTEKTDGPISSEI